MAESNPFAAFGPNGEAPGTHSAVAASNPFSQFGPNGEAPSGETMPDFLFEQGTPAAVMDAFGQGVKQGWGAEPLGLSPESEEFLKKAGIFNDAQEGHQSWLRTFNEALIRPAAMALDAARRAGSAVIGGLQAGVAEAGERAEEAGLPGAAGIGRAIAGLPEAFPLGGVELGRGVPHAPEATAAAPSAEATRAAIEALSPDIATARSLGVIGEGEGGWLGTAEPTPPNEDARAAAVRQAQETAAEAPDLTTSETPAAAPTEAAPPPDIHQVARQIAPDTFRQYDALTARRDTYRRWLDDLGDTRQQEAEANAPHADEIADLQRRLQSANPRMTKIYQARLDPLLAERDAYVADRISRDTPDMTRVRQDLQQNDYAMRDLAPDVSAAYRQAQEQMPMPELGAAVEAIAGETASTAEEATPGTAQGGAETPEAPAAGQEREIEEAPPAVMPAAEPNVPPRLVPNVHDDAFQQLVAAGRPVDEANAGAALVAAHYDARAARFDGAKGTGAELYAAEAPKIEAGRPGAKASGSTVLRNGAATIRLMSHADASTFVHELGHSWLEELLRDASEEGAPQNLLGDAKTVRDWLGVGEGETIPTRAHEKFARGFERYMMEGRSPTAGLARVFAQFKDWLTTIYRTVGRLRSPITDDIRDVFDRLLATPGGEPVIAPDLEIPHNFADEHEALAERTPPATAHGSAERVRAEADRVADERDPEVYNELVGSGPEPEPELSPANAGANAPENRPADRNAAAPGPVVAEAATAEPAGAVGAGRGAAEAQGSRLGAEPTAFAPGPIPAGKPGERALVKVPREPRRLVDYLRSIGGIQDEGGDIRHSLGGAKYRPGLINGKGLSIDDAAIHAWEEGYFPEHRDEPPSRDELLSRIVDDLRGVKVYSEKDEAAANAYRDALSHNAEVDRLAQELGLDPLKMSKADFFNEVEQRLSEHQRDAEQARMADAAAVDFAEAEQRAREWTESRGDAWQPDVIYADAGSRSLEDLERELAEEQSSPPVGAGAGGAEQPGPAAGGAEPVQVGGRQGGGRAQPGTTEIPAGPNEPFAEPASRYADKAGNIRLDLLGTPEDINQAIRDTAAENDDFLGMRRGVISDAEALRLADALGMDAAKLNLRKIGQAFNAEEVIAARKLLVQSAASVRDAMTKAADGNDADLIAYAAAKARHRMIQGQVAGITAEAGRALRAFREMEGSEEARDVGRFLETATGRTLFQLRREAQAGARLDTPGKVSKFVADSDKPGFFDWLQSYFVNALISGPATHGTYMIGNALLGLFKAAPETAAAALVGRLRTAGEADAADRVMFGEVPRQLVGAVRSVELRDVQGQLFGAMQGTRTGWRAAWNAFLANETLALPGEKAATTAFSAHNVIPNPEVGGVTLPIGTVLEAPSRVVTALHSLTRTVSYASSIHGQAYRIAAGEGLAGDRLAARINQLVTDPTEAMMKEAVGDANENAMMQRPAYDSLTAAVSRVTNRGFRLPDVPLPGGKALPLGTLRPLKFVDPFVQISSNIINATLVRRTPIGLLSPTIRDDLSGANGGVAFDRAAGRMLAGTTFMVGAGALAAEGLITGSGPTDPRQKSMLRMTGWQPYSIKIGDTYYGMHRLGVLGMQLGIAADLWDVSHAISTEDGSTVATMAAHAFAQNILDESFMRGPAELMQALNDSDRYGPSFVRNFLSSFVPFSVGAAQIARTIDPYTRQTRTVMDAIKAKIPGLSEELYPRRDIWGEPMPNWQSVLPGVTAIYMSHIKNDPVNRELAELHMAPAYPQRKIRGVELSEGQYDDYSRIAGRMAKQRLDQIVPSPGFRQLPQLVRREVISKTIAGAREAARSYVMMRNPAIISQAIAAKTAGLNAGRVAQ